MFLRKKNLLKLSFLGIGLLVFIGGIITFYNFNQTSIHNELTKLYLLPRPEKLTELYFKDHAHLPTSATSNQTISFSFVIHNLETTDYRYVYSVFINTNGTRHIVNSGTVLVRNEQFFVKHEEFRLVKSAERQQIVVELPNKQQSIGFWINSNQ